MNNRQSYYSFHIICQVFHTHISNPSSSRSAQKFNTKVQISLSVETAKNTSTDSTANAF